MSTRRSSASGTRAPNYRTRRKPVFWTTPKIAGLIAVVVIIAAIIGVVIWNQMDSKTVTAQTQSAYTLKEPANVQVVLSANKKKANISWKGQEQGASFQIQQSTNSLFVDAKNLEVKSSEDSAYVARGLNKHKTYYFRIRAKSGKNYSKWAMPSNVSKDVTATMSNFGTQADLLDSPGQDISEFDTMEGTCSDGKNLYCILAKDGGQGQAKIVKMKISNSKVTKISDALDLGGASDITYNPKSKTLVIVGNKDNPWNVTSINPKKLSIKQTVTLTLPTGLAGATKGELSVATGITGIAYNSSTKGYIAFLGGTHALAELDSSFLFTRYINIADESCTDAQGIEVISGNVVICKKEPNMLSVCNLDGDQVGTVSIPNDHVLSGVTYVGDTVYVGIYRGSEDSDQSKGCYVYKLDSF